MTIAPTISVLMPVYNGEKYLVEAIESILNQTYSDFEFIIIDDCSTDGSYLILQDYARKDKRVKLFRNEVNNKLPKTLNFGILQACGKYIARMDQDDISLPERFAKQVEFMESNPDIGVCGTGFQMFTFDVNNVLYTINHLANNNAIRVKLFFKECVIAHPTVFIRTIVFRDNNYSYNVEYSDLAEDYELWSRLARHGVKFHNLQEILLFYRLSENQITTVYAQKIQDSSQVIIESNVRYFFDKYLSEKEILLFLKFSNLTRVNKLILAWNYNVLIDKMISINNLYHLFDVEAFDFMMLNSKINVSKILSYLNKIRHKCFK